MWDIARREDVPIINSWLKANCSEFQHQGSPVEDSPSLNPVLDQKFMLVERHRVALKRETGVELWHFEQHLGEGVLIPGGCPHQVRNLKSCCKVGGGGRGVNEMVVGTGGGDKHGSLWEGCQLMSCCKVGLWGGGD